MFVSINNINYFVIPDNKSPIEIFYEVFNRMSVQSISPDQKRSIINQISEQLQNEMLSNNVYRSV